MAAQFYKINYKSDFVLTINSDAGWAVPFCIKFWTGMPSQAYFAGFDGENYVNCRVGETPTQLLVMFDDHHMPIGELKMQIAYHTTIEEFPDRKFDEVTNPVNVTVDIDGTEYQVMLDFTGETGAEIDFSMPSSGVMSVNGKIGYVTLNAEDVGAQPTIEDLNAIRSGAAAGATAVQPDGMTAALATKQDVINDLPTIRSGAAAGATAVQPAALQEGLAGKQDTISDLATIRSGAAAGATAVQTDEMTAALAEKQDVIEDLATIRNGAAAGATAVQPAAMNTALAAKQDTLTFDNTPTANSNNPVKSSGIKTALDAKQSTISTVNVTVDNNTGTPSGSASVSGSTLSLSFQNLKGATGATGATGPQGPQGERGLPGESGVTGDVSGFTVIQTIDPSATYGATDIAGAATVQATNQELTELAGLKNAIRQDNDNIFVVVDKNGVISLKIDSDGVKVRKIIICDSDGNTLKEINASVLLISDIEDSVESSSPVKVLSAKQGNLLDGRIANLEEIIQDNVPDELQVKDSNGYCAFKIDSSGLVHLNKVMGHGNGLFAIEDENGYYALKISDDGKTSLVISKDSFVNAFNDYKEYLDLTEIKTDLDLLLPPYLFSVANYCYSDTPLSGNYGIPSKRNYAPVMYLDRLVKLDSDGVAPNVTFLGGKTSMRIANTSSYNNSDGGEFNGTSIMRTIKNYVVGEKYNNYEVSIPLYVAKNTNLLNRESSIGRKLNVLCFGDSETDQGEWSSYIRKLVLMDNVDYKKKTSTQTDVMDIHLVGTRRDSNNESFTYRGENITTATGNYNEGRGSWACYTYLRHAKLYTWGSVTYNSTTKSILHCAWHELGLFTSEGREYQGTNTDKELIGNTCSGYYTLTESDLDGWVWNNNRGRIGLSNVDWDSATVQDKQDMLTYLNTTLLNSPDNPFYSKGMVVSTDGDYAFSWDAYYGRYKNRDINGSLLQEQGTSAISDSFVCIPDFVCMNLGTNDTAAFSGNNNSTVRVGLVYKLAQIIHSQIGCPVIVFTPASTSRVYMSGAEEGYGYAQSESVQSVQHINTVNMKSFFGTLSQQETNGIYFCPTYWTQRFGVWCSNNYVDIGEDVTEIGTIISSNEVHPDKQSYDDWGYMLYSMIQYLLR